MNGYRGRYNEKNMDTRQPRGSGAKKRRTSEGIRKTSPDRAERSVSRSLRRSPGQHKKAGTVPGTRGRSSGNSARTGRTRASEVLKMRLIICACALAAVVIFYAAAAHGYRHKFLPNTHVNGFDVGRLSVADTEDILKKSVEKYRLELAFRGGQSELITSGDIGLTYVSSNEVEKLMENQNRLGWIASFFGKKSNYAVKTSFHFDSAVLRRYLESLPEFSESYITAPRNSSIVLDSDHTFRVSTEFQGNKPNEDVIFAAVDEAVNSSASRLSLTSVPGAYAVPSVTSDDTELADRAAWLNKYLDTDLSIKMRDGSIEKINREVLASWATKDDNGLYTLDDDTVYMKIYRMLENAAAKFDETYDRVDFHSTNLGVVSLKCSTPYGYKINIDSQTEKIFSKVYAHKQGEYEIENSLRATTEEKIGSTYIEVDVTNQYVYYYMDGKLFMETPCVTGLESDYDRKTPSGCYAIFNLEENMTLGSLNSIYEEQRYESHVDYWMPFFESYGLHDATWRENFGGEIYKQYGSHGCVNLPPEAAKKLFKNLDVWTPVLVCRASDAKEEASASPAADTASEISETDTN